MLIDDVTRTRSGLKVKGILVILISKLEKLFPVSFQPSWFEFQNRGLRVKQTFAPLSISVVLGSKNKIFEIKRILLQ